MKINLTNSEKLIAVIAFVTTAVFLALFFQVNKGVRSPSRFDTSVAINYTMARPEQPYSEYTLDGRELEHTFEGLPEEKTAVKATKTAKLDKNKQELNAKKAVDSKKKEVVTAKLQTAIESQKKAQAELKTQAPNDNKNYRAADSTTGVRGDAYFQLNNQGHKDSGKDTGIELQNQNTDNENIKTNKKTFAEWRSLLFASPTPENLAQFIKALHSNEVTSVEYQAMAQDLIDQSDAKLKGLGLMALRSNPSLESLSQLVHLEAAAVGHYQSYIEQSLNAYLQPQNLQYLNQALATKNKKLVVKSLTLLSVNLLKFNQGDFTALIDSRNSRNGDNSISVAENFSLENYRSLLPVLSELGVSQDPELSGLAQQSLRYLAPSVAMGG